MNKSDFLLIGGSRRYSRFSIGSLRQTKSFKSPTRQFTTKHSGSAVCRQSGLMSLLLLYGLKAHSVKVVDDPAVQRPLRQTRTRKPFPESLPRDEKVRHNDFP